jgi:hypothetical protein
MNERIQELKHQASLWCDENIPEQFDEEIMGYGSAWEDKFAELLVKECSQMVEDKFDFCGDEIIIAEQILKHFGVEE